MRWLTFFPSIENVHLTKDVGLVPWYSRHHGFEPVLTGRFPSDDYPALSGEVEGLNILKLPETDRPPSPWPWFRYLDKGFVQMLRSESQNFDVLHLFHLTRDTIAYGALYKKMNPQGKLYVKLDAYNEHFTARKKYSKNVWKDRVLRKVEKSFLDRVDLVSIENRAGLELVKKSYPELREKLIYLPNGSNDLHLDEHFSDGNSKKENIFLTVGRPGSHDKNYELLLRALPLIKWDDWRMIVVGPCTESFRLEKKILLREHPELADKIEFTGAITDRFTLYELYSRAKVFFLPSFKESFGIAYAEALYFGCALVGHSEMSAYEDLCDGGKFGTYYISDDEYALARGLREAAQLSASDGFVDEVRSHASQKFYWSQIVAQLIKGLDFNQESIRKLADLPQDTKRA